MNFFSKIKETLNLDKVKKQKKEERKLPKGKSDGKGARFLVWAIIVVILLIGPVAFLRANNALSKAKDSESVLAKVQDGIGEHKQDAYTSPMLEIFTNDVVDAYINIPRDEEKRKASEEKLVSFYAEGVNPPQVGDLNGFRELTSKELYDIAYEDDRAILQYKVDYRNVVIEEKEVEKKEKDGDKEKTVKEKVEEEKPTDKTALLNVPVTAAEDGGYAVIEAPYFTSVPSVKAEGVETTTNPLEDEKEVDAGKKTEITTWLEETFFPDYAANSPEDMTYIMDDPEALNGAQDFQGLQEPSVYPGKNENTYVVKTHALFKEKEVPITNAEPFTITIEEDEGKFFIQKLTKSIGGNN